MKDISEDLKGEILQINYNLKIKLSKNRFIITKRKN